jgi:thymidylate kinase
MLETTAAHGGRPGASVMLDTTAALFSRLDESQVRYCHWKSNWALEETLAGQTDVDVLVHRHDVSLLRTILDELGFRPAVDRTAPPFPSVEHFHALDEASGMLVHVHVYSRVITGGSLVKNYCLPVDGMLLEDPRRVAGIAVPSAGGELIVFVLRMLLKHTGAPELLLLRRDWADVRREVAWLATDEAEAEAARLLPIWLPMFDPDLFAAALEALRRPAPLLRRIAIGFRVRRALRPFARHGRMRAWAEAWRAFAVRASARASGRRKKLSPVAGGAIIAFVGSEATGKSTTLEEIERWLSAHFTVRRIHVGKPPSTVLTALPNLLLPAFRALVPQQRLTRVEASREPTGEPSSAVQRFPLLFAARAVLLAHDRATLLTRAFRQSANGTIILCDRYPSSDPGAPDSAQLGTADSLPRNDRVRRWLAGRETALYRKIPPPDLVVHLTAPLEVTLARNRARAKFEDEEYVRRRHGRSSALRFDQTRVHSVDTSRPAEESRREIREVIWNVL